MLLRSEDVFPLQPLPCAHSTHLHLLFVARAIQTRCSIGKNLSCAISKLRWQAELRSLFADGDCAVNEAEICTSGHVEPHGRNHADWLLCPVLLLCALHHDLDGHAIWLQAMARRRRPGVCTGDQAWRLVASASCTSLEACIHMAQCSIALLRGARHGCGGCRIVVLVRGAWKVLW